MLVLTVLVHLRLHLFLLDPFPNPLSSGEHPHFTVSNEVDDNHRPTRM